MGKDDSPQKREIILSEGLIDQDHNIDALLNLFEQLQLATVEAADPGIDMITFAQSAHYFAVILEKPSKASVKDADQSSATPADQFSAATPAGQSGVNQASTKQSRNQRRKQRRDEERYRRQRGKSEDIKPDINNPFYPKNSNETLVNPPFSPRSPSPSPSTSTDQSQPGNWWAEYDGNVPDVNVHMGDPPRWENPKPIGLVYLTASQQVWDPLHVGELSIGIIIQPEYRGKGYAREVVSKVASIAFDHGQGHRLQAILLGHVAMDRALSLFTKMNFAHEGTRRRAFFSPMEHEWKDVTYMAILDTDWVMRNVRVTQSAPKSLWDALFARHQREREELLRWEARASLKRTSSMVTIRGSDAALTMIHDSAPTPAPPSEKEFDDVSDMNGKRKADDLDSPLDLPPLDKRMSVKQWVESSSPELSFDDIFNEQPASPDGSSGSTSWDEMEMYATTSLPSHGSSNSSLFEFIDE